MCHVKVGDKICETKSYRKFFSNNPYVRGIVVEIDKSVATVREFCGCNHDIHVDWIEKENSTCDCHCHHQCNVPYRCHCKCDPHLHTKGHCHLHDHTHTHCCC